MSRRKSSSTAHTDAMNPKSTRRLLVDFLLAVGVSFALACSPSAAPPFPRVQAENTWVAASTKRSVVLIAIDGVRFHDVFEGVDPRLAKRFGIPEQDRCPATASC